MYHLFTKCNFQNVLKLPYARLFTTSTSLPKLVLEHLKKRSVIKLSGKGTAELLQGLITNDIKHLEHETPCMYTMFLNTKGRVLVDSIIYKTSDPNTHLLECDTAVLDTLIRHLQIYKVRRKVNVESTGHHVYVLFDANTILDVKELRPDFESTVGTQVKKICSAEESKSGVEKRNFMIFKDPRIVQLGYRILLSDGSNLLEELNNLFTDEIHIPDHLNYRYLRYTLGIGEGVEDLPVEKCFPLECNCDYLHGISFHKGCYIGQELTARTHHTGVVRKRLLPLLFEKPITKHPTDMSITHSNVNLGNLKGIEGDVGLGLLRIEPVMKLESILVSSTKALVRKPFWWPVEAPREVAAVKA